MSFCSRAEYALAALKRYWAEQEGAVRALPLVRCGGFEESAVPNMHLVPLPEWAADTGVRGELLVPAESLCPVEQSGFDGELWRNVDWLHAAWWYLSGSAERIFESKYGPIGSVSGRLRGWDGRVWERAWANRIAMFLRRWATRVAEADESRLFGPLPVAEIILTHDIDAVRKTPAIRCKQTIARLFAARDAVRLSDWEQAVAKCRDAATFFLRSGEYDQLARVAELESRFGLKSIFFVYAGCLGPANRTRARHVIDPKPYLHDASVVARLRDLANAGWSVGLHPSYASYDDAGAISGERRLLSDALGLEVSQCRQHWLRFSWERTWKAQMAAGIRRDMTLGFNDREGFRLGAALEVQPWDAARSVGMALRALPLVLMDSHVCHAADAERDRRIRAVLDEVKAVGGQASVLWHPHVLSSDFGWQGGFETVLGMVGKDGAA